MHHSELVYVKRIKGKGRGVFARVPIARGSTIEEVPVLVLPAKDFVDGHDNPSLRKYFYHWGERNVAVCLGYGCLYNHSFEPNAVYEHGHMAMLYRALRNIAKDEEITINYNFWPRDKTPVDFEVV